MSSLGRHEDDEFEVKASSARAGGGRVYLPCPLCGSAVALVDEHRIAADPATYECPTCGSRFYLVGR